jgi:hypothetical protein
VDARRVPAFRADIETNYLQTLALAPSFADRVRRATRTERFYGTADVPNYFRQSHGPGWALVGDAGYHKDPITAQGIGDAFTAAELLVDAIDDGFAGRRPLDAALADYQRQRDAALPMYDFTCQLAALEPPPPEMQALFGALRHNQQESDRFFGALAGTVPIPEFFSEENQTPDPGVSDRSVHVSLYRHHPEREAAAPNRWTLHRAIRRTRCVDLAEHPGYGRGHGGDAMQTNLLIGETFVEGQGAAEDILNPATGARIAAIPSASPEQIDAAVTAAAGAFESWGRTTPGTRAGLLLKLADRIEADAEAFVALESQNCGKPLARVGRTSCRRSSTASGSSPARRAA